MSAAKNISDNWPTLAVGFIGSLIICFTTFSLNANDQTQRDQNAEIKKAIDEKADKKWVEEKISESEEKQRIYQEWMMKTLDRIDKRTERLEDKIK